MSTRFSVYSTQSAGLPGGRPSGNQVSTTTLLNALHAHYTSGLPYQLDAGSSLVVNTWLTAAQAGQDGHSGGILDHELAARAWEHARRRAEDGCIVLSSTHQSTPSVFEHFLTTLPLSTPNVTFSALSALNPFLRAVTSFNPSYSLYSAFSANFTFTLKGDLVALNLALSTSGLNVQKGLLDIPTEPGYRAFDVFYYLLTSTSTPAEREFLALKEPSMYALLNKSGTYTPPSYIPTADDAAAAEDFRAALRAIGIKGASLRNLLSVLAGILKLGNAAGFLVDKDELEETCDEVGDLLGVDPEILLHKCATDERELLITGIYEALVDWVISKANEAIANELQETGVGGSGGQWNDDDTVSITVVDIPRPAFGKAVALRNVFDDNQGINAEMKEDGVPAPPVGQAITNEMAAALEQFGPDLGLATDPARDYELDKRQGALEKVGIDLDADSFLRQILTPVEGQGIAVGRNGRFDLANTLGSSRVWHHISIHPTDDLPETLNPSAPTAAWAAGVVSRQIREWRLAEWANRRLKQFDFTADFDVDEFVNRYARLGCADGKDGAENWLMERGWTNGDAFVGHQRIWMRENAWWEAETMIDLKADEPPSTHSYNFSNSGILDPNYAVTPMAESASLLGGSQPNLLQQHNTMAPSIMAKSIAPSVPPAMNMMGDYGLGSKGDDRKWDNVFYDGDPENGDNKHLEKTEITFGRRMWIGLVWALTFWIPSFMLRYIGRMKRPDVRQAWREKVVLVLLILLFNGIVCFYIIAFGDLLCPDKDKAWNERELSWHAKDNDFYVGIHGIVYDITKFAKVTHGDTQPEATPSLMEPLAGLVLDAYFPPPLTRFCGEYVTDISIKLQNNDTTATQDQPLAVHKSGPRDQPDTSTKLHEITWYENDFLPKIREYQKGKLVWSKDKVKKEAEGSSQRQWVIAHKKIYDLTDYFYTLNRMNDADDYKFLPTEVTDLVKNNPGEDVSDKWPMDSAPFNTKDLQNCLDYVFYVGDTDFREEPKCTVNNWILLAFTILICAVVLVKFLAALQLGTKRRPAPQDKFVICMVPAYTEGEDSLRKGLDSLTALQYDNKRKLIFVICDGMIVGGGNDRPTPKIILDILGVDPKIDPPALPVKCIGQGSEQLNYGKVYSGLYEYEGNVVPYIVVVKVGKESEQSKSKPGNRGKRDSQVLLLNFLNRVHHRAPMSPLELEVFHQINNVIGVDPELYEYCLMVDADTSVREDSLNRLVAACANDARIAGICGETSLQNEERSWWTMIQVYEYYISHHLAKAFESLFGSVTCLPGCFCMYRLRTADKGRPLIVSDKVLKEYSDINVDTLHKKNLLALGEDRYLTTLMTKHFPTMSYKFIPDAYASTAAPETWSVLLSQRRRWINSTVHNLVELAALKDLCGFCCFSMRFVVMVDLLGTVILPATCVYLGYLIYRVASNTGPFPLVSIIMLAGIYGLQAIIFILKRQWQHIGWMIIYLCAYPIYSFILPLYSFWKQDDFSWGNTRVVIEEKGSKRVVAVDDEPFDPRSIPLQRWDDYALANNLPGRRGDYAVGQEKGYFAPAGRYMDDTAMEMDDMHSQYSSVKPASTILTGFPGHGRNTYMPPQSPAPFGGHANVPGNRNSHMSTFSRYTDQPFQGQNPSQHNLQSRHMSMGNLSQLESSGTTNRHSVGMMQSTDNLLGGFPHRSSRSPVGGFNSRPASAFDFRGGNMNGPDEASITEAIRGCLSEVDLDTVTKKQVRALVEQRLQTTLVGDKRAFLDRQIDTELANM